MTRKRLNRDKKWFFQGYPYYQIHMENDLFKGLVSVIRITGGEYLYWNYPKAGKVAVAGKDMIWLQLVPDNGKRAITVKFLPDKKVSVWYVDVIDRLEYDEDGVAVIIDEYLDVIFTPQGDVVLADRDELDNAYSLGELTREQYDEAILEGDSIINDLCKDIQATEVWCRKILDKAEPIISLKKSVVFLDVDGVLDIFSPNKYIQNILPEAVERLKRLVQRSDALVVVISDWRYGSDKYVNYCKENGLHKQQCDNWPNLVNALEEAGIPIYDVTPWDERFHTRTEEIAAYLSEHPEISNYVILDDCFSDDYSSNPAIKKHLVFVDALKGLQDADMFKAGDVMNRCETFYI